MKIEDRRCGAACLFNELKIGDVYTISGKFFYMKTVQAKKGDFDTNMICLNDGDLSWTDSNRVVAKLNARVVIE